MSNTPDIEAIVRDVLGRLRPAVSQTPPAPAAPRSEASASSSREVAQQNRPAEPSQAPAGELRLGERVITLDSLRGRLESVTRLVLPQKALVTPAAGDELRERGVEIVRGECPAGSGSNTARLLVAAIGKYDSAGLARQLGAGEAQHFGEVPAALTALALAVDGGGRALLLCDRPASAVCQANRRGPLRAAWAIDGPSAREAVESAGVNLLVLQPARHSLMQLVNIGRAFRKARPLTH